MNLYIFYVCGRVGDSFRKDPTWSEGGEPVWTKGGEESMKDWDPCELDIQLSDAEVEMELNDWDIEVDVDHNNIHIEI